MADDGRIVTRGVTHTFLCDFFADAAHTVPLTPLTAGVYPEYMVYDPSGSAVVSGIATATGSPGHYSVEYTPALTATLSTDTARYRIEWLFLTDDRRQVTHREEFDVVDPSVTAEFERDQRFVMIANKGTYLQIRLSFDPYEVELDLRDSSDNTQLSATKSGGDVTVLSDGDSYVARYQVAASSLTTDRDYVVLWTVTETVLSIPDTTYQVLSVIDTPTLLQVNSVRMLIDKFQKGSIVASDGGVPYQAYGEGEIIEYLKQGAQIINSFVPVTNWDYVQIRGLAAMSLWHVAASAWVALVSQFILETDLQFEFSGQSVSLNYDRTSNIEMALSRLMDTINERVPAIKLGLVRKMRGAGHVSVRPINWRRIGDTRRIGSGSMAGFTGDGMNLLLHMFGSS